MILDNLDDLNLPVKIKFTWFQKIALGCEIALAFLGFKIGRASCRERVCYAV